MSAASSRAADENDLRESKRGAIQDSQARHRVRPSRAARAVTGAPPVGRARHILGAESATELLAALLGPEPGLGPLVPSAVDNMN